MCNLGMNFVYTVSSNSPLKNRNPQNLWHTVSVQSTYIIVDYEHFYSYRNIQLVVDINFNLHILLFFL